MGRERVLTGFWLGNLKKKDHSEDLDADGSIILKGLFEKYDGGVV